MACLEKMHDQRHSLDAGTALRALERSREPPSELAVSTAQSRCLQGGAGLAFLRLCIDALRRCDRLVHTTCRRLCTQATNSHARIR